MTYQNKYCKNKQTYEYVVPEPKGVITDINLTSMEEFHLPSEILKKFKRNEYTYDQMLELVYKYNDNCRFSALIRKPDGTEDWEKIPGYIEIVFKEGEPVVHFQIPNKDFRIIKPGTSKELEQVISSVMGYTYENQSFNPTLHFPIVGDDKEDEKKKEQIKQNSCILKKDYENNEPAIDGIPVSILLDANVSKIYVSPYTEYEWKKALLDPEYGYDDVTLIDDDGYQDNPKPGTYQVTYQNKYCKNTQTFTYILPKAQGEILEIDKKIPEFHLPSKLLHKLNPDDYSDDEIKELIYKYNDYKVNVKVKKPDGSIVWEKISPVVHVFFNSGKLKVSLGLPSNSFRLIDVGASKELEDAVSSYMGYTYDDHDDDRLDFGKSFDVIAD